MTARRAPAKRAPAKRGPSGRVTAPRSGDDQTIDLDAHRSEVRTEPPPTIRFLGDIYTLPYEPPASIIEHGPALSTGDSAAVLEVVRVILGSDTYERMSAKADAAGDPLGLGEIEFLLTALLDRYGLNLGESPASAPAS